MELVNLNDSENSFDPTPKLKSSPVPISFVSFNTDDDNCIYCGEKYINTPFYYYYNGHHYQKYCKKCLSSYLNKITDNNIYLDVYLYTKNLECNEHEISKTKEPQNIQECCKNCLKILSFKQLPAGGIYCSPLSYNLYNNVIESERYCKLCGKSLYQGNDNNIKRKFKLCPDCYIISIESIESTLTKKPIPIIYLPFWDDTPYCRACKSKLTFTSDCQKYCKRCYIFYIGCRYCLTTNITFGFTNKSQCKKCKRMSSIVIDITNFLSGNSDLDEFLVNSRHDQLKIDEFADKIKNIDKYFIPTQICDSIYEGIKLKTFMEWIPYSQFTNIEKIAEGGFGIIYKATWSNSYRSDPLYRRNNETIILKRFKNSQDISEYFLNEVNHFYICIIYF